MGKITDTLDAKNASVLAELVVDPLTTDHSRVAILNMLLSTADEKDFFTTMFKEGLSMGQCPECNHENHWLIPEDILNQIGWVTSGKDDRVKQHTTKDDCPKYQEACPKKKDGILMMDKTKLAEELHEDEGFRSYAYKDSLGYLTIGVGRLIDKEKGGGITEDEANFLLHNDINEKYHQLVTALPWVVDHPDDVQRALTNMAFQLGLEGLLKFKRTIALIQARNYVEAANNALLSKWASQTPKRAKKVTDLIRNAD